MSGLPKFFSVAWDLWRTRRGGAPAIAARRQSRLASLIAFARAHSPFYAQRYRQLPPHTTDLQSLPPVTKSDLMAHFDEWVTDPQATRASVDVFVADRTRVGQPYLGRYAVWTTSGVTGECGIFVHDADALAVYVALLIVRGFFGWVTARELWEIARRNWRTATVMATGGHFASTALKALVQRLPIASADKDGLSLSVLTPLPELVRGLNDWQPAILAIYPSTLRLLMEEQEAGRLKVNPVLIGTGGEWLAPADRQKAARLFGCKVQDAYAASECMGIAFDCAHGWLHLNADWVIVEPVDRDYQPVPPGETGHTVLLTNLASRVQPVIRYDLGDSITMKPDPCPCGSPLPALRVEGRTSEILSFRAADGEVVRLPSMALLTVVEEVLGVRRLQVIQTTPAALRIRLEIMSGADEAAVWEAVARQLYDYLAAQGLASVQVERAAGPPRSDPVSGKFRLIWSEVEPAD